VSKVAPLPYDDRTVYSVASFNRGVSTWLAKLPTVWVEGEVTELKRHDRWASVFFTLKDPEDGSCVPASMQRGKFDGLRLDLADGERVHVFGRPELFEQRGDFRLRALTRLGPLRAPAIRRVDPGDVPSPLATPKKRCPAAFCRTPSSLFQTSDQNPAACFFSRPTCRRA